uniref:ABC transporter n=1 Tax=Noctiluca scintillans TaxID=2966 RepID=A0A7S0ZQ66_NOCSC|mmetsp:Transcript_1439/g.3868  ORF Transcript_1439/g.3868 Transcript_1439/m.3868 type:complete len:680 (+) Transcript_1439:53-2092(+)
MPQARDLGIALVTIGDNTDRSDSRELVLEDLAEEDLRNDPEWTPGCWLASYFRMHHSLLVKAQEIQREDAGRRQNTTEAAGTEEPTVAGSMALLRREVFSLCPMHLLYMGIATSFVLTVITFITPRIQGNLVDAAVDALVARKNGQYVDIWELLRPGLTDVAILTILSYFCEIMVGIFFAICGHTTVTRLRVKLFKNLVEQDISFYDAHVSGELASRLINDSSSLSYLVQFTTQNTLGATVKFIGSLIAMFTTHVLLALVSTIVTPINTILVNRTGKTVGFYGVVQNHAMAKANAVAIEVLGNIRTVQSNVGEFGEALRFRGRLNHYLRVIKATVYVETVLRFTQFGLSRIRNVIILGMAMRMIVLQELTIGAYTAFSQYLGLYEDGFRTVADMWINFKQTITSTGKFVQLLLRVPDVPMYGGLRPHTCSGSLVFDDVSFEYASRPGKQILSRINMSTSPGTIIALVGESGAGKTTLGRLLQRYYDPVDGRILLDGVDYRQLDIRWLRAQIGFVEQEPVLFDRPIHENMAYGAASGLSREDVRRAARLANADEFILKLADGYETHPGEKAMRISGGQKQRIAIARAIIRQPKILLLDEATSALDSENEFVVQQALDNVMLDRTTFIIAHRLSTVVRATKILVLDKGKVIEQGSHAELVENEQSRYASFMRHQLVGPLLA